MKAWPMLHACRLVGCAKITGCEKLAAVKPTTTIHRRSLSIPIVFILLLCAALRVEPSDDLHEMCLGMLDCSGFPTPIAKTRVPMDLEHPIADPSQVTMFRHCVSVARFLRHYKPEINFAVKELSHALQCPCAEDWKFLKRLARFLHHLFFIRWRW